MSGITRSRIRYEKTCTHCQTIFTVAEYRKNTALFCSRKCMALNSRQQVVANCVECGVKFKHISSRANKAKYCGRKCYYKAMLKKGKTQYYCAHCGVGFLGSLSHNRKYCSIQCVNKGKKETFIASFTTVRKAMLRRGLITQCGRCGYATEPKILGVHHKDRNRKNNALDNLEVVCPNCHSLEHAKHICQGFSE